MVERELDAVAVVNVDVDVEHPGMISRMVVERTATQKALVLPTEEAPELRAQCR